MVVIKNCSSLDSLPNQTGSREARCTAPPSWQTFDLGNCELDALDRGNDNIGEVDGDLLISSEHSFPTPRGAPMLNHIGAQQLSLVNWVLGIVMHTFNLGKMMMVVEVLMVKIMLLLLIKTCHQDKWRSPICTGAQ